MNLKPKVFNREKAKLALEAEISEYVRKLFDEETKKAKNHDNVPLGTLDNNKVYRDFFDELRKVSSNLNEINKRLDDPNTGLNLTNRRRYQSVFSKFISLIEDIHSNNKKLPIKINKWLKHQLSVQNGQLIDFRNSISNKIPFFCGSARKKTISSQLSHIEGVLYFWECLCNCEEKDVGFEKLIAPEFEEQNFKSLLKNIIDRNYPPEEKPQIIKEEKIQYKYVEKPVTKPDNVRLAHELLYGIGRPQEIAQALTYYHEEAQKNHNVFACNALGQIFYEGIFVRKDLSKSISFYRKSADQNDPEALYRFGRLLEEGADPSYQPTEANLLQDILSYYKRAAKQGHLNAITDLGYLYHYGLKISSSLTSSAFLPPSSDLPPSLISPSVLPSSFPPSSSSIHPPLTQPPPCVGPLSTSFLISPNVNKAFKYYKIAKKRKFPRALNNLGKFLMEEGGDKVKGIKYMEMAWFLGYVKAGFNLAICYLEGKGANIDREKALSLLKEAGSKGDIQAKLFYIRESLRDKEDEDNLTEMALILHEIIEKDPFQAEALFYLGFFHEKGIGVEKDEKISFHLYNKAARLNYPEALNKLGEFFYCGKGVSKDPEKAKKYFEMAVDHPNPNENAISALNNFFGKNIILERMNYSNKNNGANSDHFLNKKVALISGYPFSLISKQFVKKQIEFEGQEGEEGPKERPIMKNSGGKKKNALNTLITA